MTRTLRGNGSFYWMLLTTLAVLSALMVMMAARPAHASTTFTVNSTLDPNDPNPGDNICDANLSNVPVCTLRAAINQANATPGADIIKFNIPGTGVHTIQPNSSGYGDLPTITDPVTIDGYSQPGAFANTLAQSDNAGIKIDLDGSKATEGLYVRASSGVNHTTIKGLAIHDFGGRGIRIEDGDKATTNVVIQGNYIGTDPSGATNGGNKYVGVYIDGTLHGGGSDLIGGSNPAARNVISGHESTGVGIIRSSHNVIQGNYIGTDRDGTDRLTSDDMGNGTGVAILSSSGNEIGGVGAGERNVISNSRIYGIRIERSSYDYVESNLIGTDRTRQRNLGNKVGITVQDSQHTFIGWNCDQVANTIAYSVAEGVQISEGTDNIPDNTYGNRVECNSIYSNGGLGIDLGSTGVTQNDVDDVDSGPNDLQNFAVITSARMSATGKTTIEGKLDSVPNNYYQVDLFSNPKGTDEGKKYIGNVYLSPNATGDYTFSYTTTLTSLGKNITASVRNYRGNSEFSAPKKVVAD